MPKLLFLLLLTALVGPVFSKLIRCRKGYCASTACLIYWSEEQCKARNEEHRPISDTLCQCCSGCVPYIPEGGACGMDENKDYYYSEVRNCEPGLSCINRKCKKQ